MKNFKYELLNTGQNISVCLIYETKINQTVVEKYILTEELLNAENISLKKMILFLKDELPPEDDSYSSCSLIFSHNHPIEKIKKSTEISDQNKIIRIITSKFEWKNEG
tara:strand:+ start:3923 stop:4246 length:324 start_codon:yes stop_codon:yes gene_type:complete